MKFLKILIRGGSWVNKGGEAMLCTAQEQLSSRLAGARFFTSLPPSPIAYNAAGRFSPTPETNGSRLSKGLLLVRALRQCPKLFKTMFSDSWTTLQAIAAVNKADAVLDVSGFAYSDDWGDSYAARTWVYAYYAHRQGKPYIFLPQAWGPFRTRSVARLTGDLIRWSPLVCVRDQQSMSYVEELFGELDGHMCLTPDIAFRFQPDPPEVGEKLVRALHVRGGGSPLIGIAPNMRVYERMPGSGRENRYVQLMADVIRWAWRMGASALLIPHEISFAKDPQDDRFLCRLIKDEVGDGGPVAVLDGMYSASEIKSVIGCIDLLVSSRFHSIVAALSCRIPAVVLGWSHKYVELMRSVDMEELVLDYDKSKPAYLLDRIDTAWKRRQELRSRLETRLPAIEDETGRVFDMVARLVTEGVQ